MAVVIVTLVTAVNEYKKEQQFQELNKVKGETTTSTVRGGTEQAGVDSGTVVVGDVVSSSIATPSCCWSCLFVIAGLVCRWSFL